MGKKPLVDQPDEERAREGHVGPGLISCTAHGPALLHNAPVASGSNMAARPLPPPLLRYDGQGWALMPQHYSGQSAEHEWKDHVPFSWSLGLAHLVYFPGGRYRQVAPAVQDSFRAGTFVPWFVFESDDMMAALILDPELAYHLSGGADVTLWLWQPGRHWSPGTRRAVSGRILHFCSPTRDVDPMMVYRPFMIWHAAVFLARTWRRRRRRRRHLADQVRVAFELSPAGQACLQLGVLVGSYVGGAPMVAPGPPGIAPNANLPGLGQPPRAHVVFVDRGRAVAELQRRDPPLAPARHRPGGDAPSALSAPSSGSQHGCAERHRPRSDGPDEEGLPVPHLATARQVFDRLWHEAFLAEDGIMMAYLEDQTRRLTIQQPAP